MPDQNEIPDTPGRTAGKAEGEREIGTEYPLTGVTPGQAEGERRPERDEKKR